MIDLHMHSYFSDDGQYSEEELILKCHAKKVKIMAISDHDEIQANSLAKEIAKKYGIQYLNSIEITCLHKGKAFHLLGYGFQMDDAFKAFKKNIERQNKEASLKRLKKVQELGFDIGEADLRKLEREKFPYTWAGEMFAEVLLNDARYIDHPLLLPYRKGNSRSINPYVNFYWDYFAQGKPCYAKIDLPSMQEAVEVIHKFGGIAVLAHPGMNLKTCPELLDSILDLKIDGLEVCSSYHNQEETDYYYKVAKEHHLMMTCGSDYHGRLKPAIEIGGFLKPSDISIEDFWLKLENDLKERKLI